VNLKNADGEFHMETFPSQDAMAWETQGPVYDRTSEILGESDRGITFYRKMLMDQIHVVQQGEEPMALVHNDEANKIIEFVTTEWRGGEE